MFINYSRSYFYPSLLLAVEKYSISLLLTIVFDRCKFKPIRKYWVFQ